MNTRMKPQQSANELGQRLREARESCGPRGTKVSQATLADWCGIGQDKISMYERGFRVPSPRTLAVLCSALELPFDELMRLAL